MHGTTSLADAHASTQGGPRTIFEGRSIAFRYAGSSRGRVSGGGPDPRVNMISCFVEHISWAMWTCSTSGLSFGFPCIAVLHTWGPWLAQLSGVLWSAPHSASTVSSPAHKPLPGLLSEGSRREQPSSRHHRAEAFARTLFANPSISSAGFRALLTASIESYTTFVPQAMPYAASSRCAQRRTTLHARTASYFRRRHVPPPYAMLSAVPFGPTS